MRRCKAPRPARSIFLLFLAALFMNSLAAVTEVAAGGLDSGSPVFLDSGMRYGENVIVHLDRTVFPIRVSAGSDTACFRAAIASIETIRGYAGRGNTYVDCPVAWDFSAVDRSVPGVYPAKGRVAVPAGFQLSAELLAEAQALLVETQIYVYREGFRRVTKLPFYETPSGPPLLAVPTGTTELAATLDQRFQFVVELDSFEKVRMDRAWDLGCVDCSAPGLYVAQLCLIPPAPDIEIPQEFCRLPVQVLVQKPGEPNLAALAEYKDFYFMPVILTEAEHRRLQAWYQINGGEWIAEDREKGAVYLNSRTPFEVRIQKENMRPGNTYAFKVTLDSYTSDILEIAVSDNQFTAAIRDGQGGQRDETGRKEHPLPPLRQPPPKGSTDSAVDARGGNGPDGGTAASGTIRAPKSEPDPCLRSKEALSVSSDAPELLWEEVTPERTVLAQKRLGKLLEYNPGHLLFEKHGITVQIPSSWLAALRMTESSLLSVTIEPLDESSFYFDLAVDGEPPPSLPAFQISMPFAAGRHGAGNVAVFNESGSPLADAVYDAKTGRVTFSVSAMGIFCVGDRSAQPAALTDAVFPDAVQTLGSGHRKGTWSIGVWLFMGCIAVGLLFFAMKRKRGRK